MLPVATAIPRRAPKINACVLCVRVLWKTRRSFIRSFSRLSKDASYLRTGVKVLIGPRINGPTVGGAGVGNIDGHT